MIQQQGTANVQYPVISYPPQPAKNPADRCNEKVAAWKYAQPARCNLERGHAGECDHR